MKESATKQGRGLSQIAGRPRSHGLFPIIFLSIAHRNSTGDKSGEVVGHFAAMSSRFGSHLMLAFTV
jgi:hypothetical protein